MNKIKKGIFLFCFLMVLLRNLSTELGFDGKKKPQKTKQKTSKTKPKNTSNQKKQKQN